jgi:hypothetical protein
MTTRKRTLAGSWIVIALSFLVGLAAYWRIPLDGRDDRLFFRLEIAFALPAATLVVYLLFRSLWRHDRIRTGNGAFEATYHAIVFRTMVFVFAMHALLMLALTDVMDVIGTHTWGKRVVVVMLGLAIMAIGNLLPRTRPNIAFGLRTDLTLTNPQLWQKVHRVGGYAAVGLGAVILMMGVTAANQNLAGAMVLPGAAVAAGIVYLSYRRYASA